MKIESTLIYPDRIEFLITGDKNKEYLAKIEIYHWKVFKELGINLTDILKIAFGGRYDS